MRLLHAADLHLRKERIAEIDVSLAVIEATAREESVDLIALCGDIWDGPVTNTAGALFPTFLSWMQRLADIAPVALIYGTPSHDTEGSLEVFASLKARHAITILSPGVAYGLSGAGLKPLAFGEDAKNLRLLVFGIPEPSKKWLSGSQPAMGKDESDARVRDALGALCLGLAGKRAAYPHVPALCLYHGQVSTAKTGTGYTVESGSGIAIGRDQLESIGADYYALGDIHEPQQILGLSAWYAGSIYACDFGETHSPGCQIVDIQKSPSRMGFDVDLRRIEFGQAVNVLVKSDAAGAKTIPFLPGKRIRWEIRCTGAEAARIDTDELLSCMMAHGAALGSRVSLDLIPVETVRAGDIGATSGLADKLSIWGENSGMSIQDSVLQKAKDLEAASGTTKGGSGGAQIRIDRLKLRGATGIWKKSRKDEIDLDLAGREGGVIAFVGKNGAGKTTIVENLHPWPRLLTREGSLKSHFRLRDSYRDLHFTDMRTGKAYRSFLEIDGATLSGSTKCYLYARGQNGYAPLPGINGRLEPYESAVNELFGPIDLFLRTAFVTQRPARGVPDLSEATKGERKSLFAQLAGIEYLEAHRNEAHMRAETASSRCLELAATARASSCIETDAQDSKALIETQTAETTLARQMIAEIRDEAEGSTERAKSLRERVSSDIRIEERITALARSMSVSHEKIARATQEIETYDDAVQKRTEANEVLDRFSALSRRAEELCAQREALVAEDQTDARVWQTTRMAAEHKRETVRQRLETARRTSAKLERDREVLKSKATKPLNETCPTCGQALPEAVRRTLTDEREKLKLSIDTAEAALGEAMNLERAITRELAAIALPSPPAPRVFENADELYRVERDMEYLDTRRAKTILARAEEATIRVEQLRLLIQDEGSSIETQGQTCEALRLQREAPSIHTELRQTEQELESLREEIAEWIRREAASGARLERETERLRILYEAIQARKEALTAMETECRERDDWQLLERALGKDGIQALELDALSPGIAEVANRLLAASQTEGRIEFRTTRLGGTGARQRQIEDFLIMYLDASGEEQELSTLSGGEAVWVRKAIYDAFAVVRARNTGTKFATVILDEADGALDPEARIRYMRMIEAAHRESGRHHTIMITHSTELQAMASMSIDIANLEAPAGEMDARTQGRRAA